MRMPWQLVEAGPGARSVYIALATGCFAGRPTVQVAETKTTIRIQAFGWRPAVFGGHLDIACASEVAAGLRAPIEGRQIKGESWPTPLRFGSLTHQVVARPLGLPRLLGLSPRQAARSLWLYGFRSKWTGQGRQIIAQIPGWGLVGKGRSRPDPYRGITTLVAGSRIEIPTTPHVGVDRPAGLLAGAIRFEGGPGGNRRPPIAGTVAVFDASGSLLARLDVAPGHSFRWRVAAGRYLLLADSEGLIFCGPTSAVVRARHTTLVTVGTGCGIP
jgi:hypothetical protein